jgi:hypothetical protein
VATPIRFAWNGHCSVLSSRTSRSSAAAGSEALRSQRVDTIACSACGRVQRCGDELALVQLEPAVDLIVLIASPAGLVDVLEVGDSNINIP